MLTLASSDAKIPIRRKGGDARTVMQPFDVTLDVPIPQAVDSERAVLGSIIILNSAFYRVPKLTDEHFFRDSHRQIFRVIAYMLVELRVPVDILSLKEELARQGLLESVGGYAYVSSLTDVVPDIANVERYGDVLERMAKKRAGLIAGNALMRASLDPETEPEEVAMATIAALSPLATREEQQARPIASVLSDAFTRQQTLATANQSPALDCGWPTLTDYAVFHPTLVVLTGDRGLGKSALMVQWARNFAANGHGTAMFSLESTPNDIGLRYASMVTGIPHSLMRDWRTFSDANRVKVAECLREAAKLGIYIAQGPRTAEGIILEIRRLKIMYNIEAVFLDYIQLLGTTKRFDRHELALNHVAQELLATANDLGVMICVLSQVNKEGGVAYADSIEKSARVRLDLLRPHMDVPEKKCSSEIWILKNNEGRSNWKFPAHFSEVHQRWDEGTCEQVGHGRTTERKLFT